MTPVAILTYVQSEQTARPFLEAGWEVHMVDIAHRTGGGMDRAVRDGNLTRVGADMREWVPPRDVIDRVRAYITMPPCDHLAVSGARWFAGKGLGRLSEAVELFHHGVRWGDWLGVPGFAENPVSNIASHWRRPDHTFQPHEYTGYCKTDNYTKKTCLWKFGDFVMPEPRPDASLGEPDQRVWKAAPGPERALFRALTPLGFMRAAFDANWREINHRLSVAAE